MEIRPILSSLMRNKTGPILVALQVALSLAILANALHIVSERRAAAARPSGIADEQAVFAINASHLRSDGPEQELATLDREIALLRAVPGVVSAANVGQLPMSNSGWNTSVAIDRKQIKESTGASTYMTADSLVQTWGLKLVEGRDFVPGEFQNVTLGSREVPHAAIVTRALAAKLWPGQPGSGKTLFIGMGEDAMAIPVVGVVERLQDHGARIDERGEFSIILPMREYGANGGATYTMRAAPGQRDRVIRDAEDALRKASSDPVIFNTRTIDDLREARYRADVALSWTLVVVSLLLLLITAGGIVGMASLWVNQRRKQIGVRRALGAKKTDILRYFILENLLITSTGVFGGVLLGVGLNQLLVTRLEMARLPLGYLVAGALVLWALGILAAYGPAWRAASISPALATRSA
ncbi:FtsX-like permease family protein [Massilia sp.]|uniref:ABC transporter permease n=1 Tax=Massilia sp. TaxID=1882437 RepID=UPI00289C0E5E|nr:FtsX-like permease family protein [Massilia sp.]